MIPMWACTNVTGPMLCCRAFWITWNQDEHDLNYATFTECAIRCLHLAMEMQKDYSWTMNINYRKGTFFFLVPDPLLKTEQIIPCNSCESQFSYTYVYFAKYFYSDLFAYIFHTNIVQSTWKYPLEKLKNNQQTGSKKISIEDWG